MTFFSWLTIVFIAFQWAGYTDFSWWWLVPMVLMALLESHARHERHEELLSAIRGRR